MTVLLIILGIVCLFFLWRRGLPAGPSATFVLFGLLFSSTEPGAWLTTTFTEFVNQLAGAI